MPGKKQQLKANEAAPKTRRVPKNPKPQPTTGAQAENAPQTENATQTRRPKKMNQKDLAEIFTQKALSGDVESARLLFTMEGGKKPAPPVKKKRHGLSFAQQLALDPPWQGERPPRFVSIYAAPSKTEP